LENGIQLDSSWKLDWKAHCLIGNWIRNTLRALLKTIRDRASYVNVTQRMRQCVVISVYIWYCRYYMKDYDVKCRARAHIHIILYLVQYLWYWKKHPHHDYYLVL